MEQLELNFQKTIKHAKNGSHFSKTLRISKEIPNNNPETT